MAIESKETKRIDVHHITRVEGHGNIVVDVQEGVLKQCDLQIVEAPRFFEAMLRGQPYEQASPLSSRICGICAVTHATTSLRATEKALGVEPSEQTTLLRKLNLHGEMLDSHILHIYMLVAPDLLGAGSVIPLARKSPEVVMRALRMKKVAGDLCAVICGRHTHPIAMAVGGFNHFPTSEELSKLLERLEAMRTDLDATVDLFQNLQMPDFERETEYIALSKEDEYSFLDGVITSSDGGSWPVEQYRQVANEHMVVHSTAKHTRHQRPSYMVGALARFKLNYEQLQPKARIAAETLGLDPLSTNPYMNTIAQLVETVHCTEEAILIVTQLLERGIKQEEPVSPVRSSGEGVGACEAPRGTLYHHYVIDDGLITDANCIIPTAQNLANIEADMRALVSQRIHCPPDEITFALEMLVRAYDPCISCSTHILNVRFVL
ncbi:MAG TPA: Ni/Fe hydrogenase subunit alpha [Anaerolineae bacterium]|nr:Ni/Fe hydrogenase subunit alpha [Anaerolineae bacterium]